MLWFLVFVTLCVGIALYFSRKNKKKANHFAERHGASSAPHVTISSIGIRNGESSAPADHDENDPDKDAWEGSFWDASNPIPVKAALEFAYTDGEGKETKRTVDVREFDEGFNGGMIIGRCRLRNATRTFLFKRMSGCVDTETGESIENIAAFLKARYEASPEATLNKLFGDHYDLLRTLLYVGRADGRMSAKERSIILDYARVITGDERLDDEMIKKVFKEISLPSLLAYKQCCGRLSKSLSQEQGQRLITATESMAATEKNVNPTEQEALDYLKKRLLT